MSLKKYKKLRQPSREPASLGIPTQIALGALGINVDLDLGTGAEGGSDGKGSKIVFQARDVGQRLHASGASTQTPEHKGDVTPVHEQEREREVPSNAPNEQRDPIAPDLPAAESGPRGRDPEGEDIGGDLIGEDAHDPIQSGRSKTVERGWKDRAIGGTALVFDVAMGISEAFSPLKAALQTVSVVYGQYKETAAVKEKIDVLHSRIGVLEEVFGKPTRDEAEKNRRKELLTKLTATEETLQSLTQKSALLRFTDHVQDNEDVSGLLEDLREAINDYQMVQQMAIYEQGCKLIDAADMAVLNNLRCTQGAEFRHGDRKGCLKGTRGAILDEIEIWTRDFNRLPVYWLNGVAGSGKSTIAQTIAERMFADGRLGASFFCSRDFEDRSNLQLIFPTLAVQLARRYTEFRSAFIPLVQSDPGVAHESLYNQMDKLIVRPLQESGISAVIVIDALDECQDEEPASAILSVLGRFLSEVPEVKFFLTGRPELRIREGFRLPLLVSATDIFVLHEVKSDQVDNDIHLFFKNSLMELARRRQLGSDDWPTKAHLDLLCKRAAGLFVYAVATIKFIDHKSNPPKEQLDRILQLPESSLYEGRTRVMKSTTTDSLYTGILQEAFCDEAPEDDYKVRAILGALVLAKNPLSPSTIATLLDLTTEGVFQRFSLIQSLLTLKEINDPVKPFHKSFPDFIIDPHRCTNPRFCVYPPEQHTELLIGCLELMNQRLKKNMCKLPEAVMNSEIDDLEERKEKYLDCALQYACRSWHKHLVNEHTAHRSKITSLLHHFLEKKFLFWLEVLSVLGTVKSAIDALGVTVKWLEESPTLSLANDCFHFVTRLFEVISMSAPHIYHTALLLSPKESTVWMLYRGQASPLVKVVRGRPTSWDPRVIGVRVPGEICTVAWSPCSQFIAFAWEECPDILIVDSVTLKQLYTMHSSEEMISWESIVFSPDSCLLSGYSFLDDWIISWDLQTGGQISIISTSETGRCSSMAYSGCGTMLGGIFDEITIIIYNILSGTCISSHSVQQPIVETLWTQSEYLQFATVESESIVIWQVRFASDDTPTKINSLSTPKNLSTKLVLHPTLFRIAFILEGRILVWDAQEHDFLLDSMDVENPITMSFSADGSLFMCGTGGPEFYLWKESPKGYNFHQKGASSAVFATPVISPDGGSVISSGGSILQLWHMENFPTSLPIVITPRSLHTRGDKFLLDFSPDESAVAVAEQLGKTVTVLSLKSGNPQLVINTEMEICGMKMTGDKLIVVGNGKILTWDLLAESYDLNRGNICNDPQTTTFTHHSVVTEFLHASISPDLNYVAIGDPHKKSEGLCIYDTHTGDKLATAKSGLSINSFAQGGDEIWCGWHNGAGERWMIIREDGSNAIKMKQLSQREDPQSGFFWHSPSGYQISDDGWILSSSGKRLFWLPHYWRPEKKLQKCWSKKFLAVWNLDLFEPIILELKLEA
ncbi:hypothetical protein BJ322DRAFT_775760 [Thelephora terrestris]|uniref:NACHT domain-containing protein n=1 Tax=Thelephora terrestris TaxID=56493 RepID=A0A9P6L838_9AGAM|nr:hypothetical protein BJ322DRAFT_775760 [Thelephora terrestris]